jgi:hypothetical protein
MVKAYHSRNLSRNQRLTWWGQPHLLHQSILQGKMIPSIDQQLIFQVLWRMEVLAWRLLPITPTLYKKLQIIQGKLQESFFSM